MKFTFFDIQGNLSMMFHSVERICERQNIKNLPTFNSEKVGRFFIEFLKALLSLYVTFRYWKSAG